MDRFEGRVAVVTGAGSGVGAASAARFAREGAAVVVADIRPQAAAETVEAISSAGGRAVAQGVDVSDEAQVAAMIETAVREFGRLDILHNNAAALGPDGYQRDLDLEGMDVEVWRRTMDVNLAGAMLACKHAVPAMRGAGGGAIISTASVAAFHGGADHAAYGSSKAALIALTRYVACMHGKDRVRCNAIAPGLILSETAKAALSDEDLEHYAAERLLPWAADPEEVAGVAAWLASEEARGITGQTIVLDSGILAQRPRDAMAAWEQVLAGR